MKIEKKKIFDAMFDNLKTSNEIKSNAYDYLLDFIQDNKAY